MENAKRHTLSPHLKKNHLYKFEKLTQAMNNDKQQNDQPRPWQSPQISTLSIRNTEQLAPPDPGPAS